MHCCLLLCKIQTYMCVHKCLKILDTDLGISTEDNCDYTDTDHTIQCDSSDLTIIQHNIRGITSKISYLNHLINTVQVSGHPDVLLICESWLKTSAPKPIIEGYNIERFDRKGKKGGGVCILISTRCNYTRRPDLENYNCNSFESCFIKLQSWNMKLVIGCIYRPPIQTLKNLMS